MRAAVSMLHPSPVPSLELEPAQFRRAYNREPFEVKHRLVGHPLLTLEKLIALAKRLPEKQVLYRSADVPVATDFDKATLNYPSGHSLAHTVEHLEETGSVVTINTPETDTEYRPLILGLLEELKAQTEPLDPGLNWFATYIFISAPHSITPYHMDREMNFLFQLEGQKWVHLFDPWDLEVMSHPQVEQLFGRFDLPKPEYRESFERKAKVFHLHPGEGVHHPFIAPHWVKNGDAVSISLAITFRTRGSDRISRLYNLNHKIRKLGFTPRPVGSSATRDAVLLGAWRAAARAWRPLAKVLGKDPSALDMS